MTGISDRFLEAGLAFSLLVLAVAPALADDFPTGCIFFKGVPQYDNSDIQFIPGEAFSVAEIHDEAGKPTLCFFSIKTVPFTVTCRGKAPEPFFFIGPTLQVQTHDILIFRNAAWYKHCYTPV